MRRDTVPFNYGFLLRAIVLLAMPAICQGAPTIELKVSGTAYQGLNVAHDKQVCWLASRDGSYECFDLSRVSAFRKTGEFRSLTPSALAAELRNDLGRGFDIKARGHYVICAPPGQAEQYADLLTTVERSFNGYFSRRGWALPDSPFPLVVIIYPNRSQFDQACALTGMKPSPILRGFYHPQTNRISLYDQSADAAGSVTGTSTKSRAFSIDEESRNVAVHEAIHQLAFNAGLHQRIGKNPRWVVEGLATMLEAGALESTNRSDTSERINVDRLKQFQNYRTARRQKTIIDLIEADEEFYQSAPLDFYSEAWAFTFYLSEARRPDYVRYLKRLAARDPLQSPPDAADRLKDFQGVFGKDLRWLETQFLRFIDQLD